MKDLVLILGPMSSGKSFDLIGFFAPLKIAKRKYALAHPKTNCRDEHITSRNGNVLEAEKIDELSDIKKFADCEVIGIDEIHMFSEPDEQDLKIIKEMLNRGIKFVISGLDMDYQGRQFPILTRLLELGPSEIRMKTAVCMKCKSLEAKYTQVLDRRGNVVTEGVNSCLPDNGEYVYEPRCRRCFQKVENRRHIEEENKPRW